MEGSSVAGAGRAAIVRVTAARASNRSDSSSSAAAHALLDGAVSYAKKRGAPAIEGYPVDNGAERVNLTMAYVGTRALFESAGFEKAADTASVLDGFPRVLMRLDLRRA